MMLRTIVVDDEELPRRRVRELVSAHAQLTLIGEAADGASALDSIVAEQPDLVFLDIQMPELTGFEVIGALEREKLPAIIFVTAYDEYAVQAFVVGAFDYLLKPVTPERFHAAVERVLTRATAATLTGMIHDLAGKAEQRKGPLTRLVARRGGRHYLVRIEDVEWLESERNYVRVHAVAEKHLVRRTMKELEAQLDAQRFVRIHRSAIVAIDHIGAIEPGEYGDYVIITRSGARLPVSRGYSGRVRALVR